MRLSGLYKGVVSSAAGTGLSRVLGAVRDIILARVLGATDTSDAFWIAFTVPSIFRRFVADEGLRGVMVPALTGAEQDEGVDSARDMSGGILAALVLLCLVICVLGMLSADWLVALIAPGFGPEKRALTVDLTRWMFPFVLFVSLVSWCEGVLNIRGHFFIPKLAPGVVSACIAGSALYGAELFPQPVHAVAGGVLLGGLVHLLVCIPAVLTRWGRVVFRLQIWRSKRFRSALREMGKVMVIGIVAQLNIISLRIFASWLPSGSVTHYWYANRVVDLAQGVIAVAVGSALLPPISRAVSAGDWDRFEQTFVAAVRMAAVVLIPAAAVLAVIPGPVVATLFQHGRFDADATVNTARCLVMLVPFMLAVAGINILKQPYFALERRDLLLAVGTGGLVGTLLLGWLLAFALGLGVQGLALALSGSTVLQFLAYAWLLQVRLSARTGGKRLLGPLLRMALASLPAAGVALWLCGWGRWSEGPDAANIAVLASACLSALVVYLACVWLLGVREELNQVLGRLRRR